MQIFVPLKGLVDVEAEEKRLLQGDRQDRQGDRDVLPKSWRTRAFVDRAPAEIVAKEREKLAEVHGKKQVLEESLEKIRRLR